MTSSETPLVLRTGDLGEVLGLLGVLLGFQPYDSLIVIALTGERSRMSFKVRTDLPEVHHARDVASFVGDQMDLHRADAVLVFAVSGDAGTCDAAVEAVHEDCARRGLPVVAAARAHEGWFWTYGPEGLRGIDPPRRYDAHTSPKAVEAIVHGASVAASRDALMAGFDPPSPARVSTLLPAFEEALSEVEGFRETHDLEAFRARGRVVHDRIRSGPGEPSDLEVARLAVWVSADDWIRDHGWNRMSRRTAADDLSFWHHAVLRTVPPFEPAVLTLCGFAAWMHGSGAIARTLWERALEADDDYTAAGLLLRCLDQGVSPDECAPVTD